MSFAKLDSKITSSSLWDQPDHVVRVWIAFLAEKDENGFVCGTPGSMRRLCNVTDDIDGKKFDEAIQVLESPDENSKTPDYDGRRIERIDGGWIVFNHEKYRLHENIVREQTRERVRKYRGNHRVNKDVTQCNVTCALPSVSVSESKSVSEIKEGVQGEKQNKAIYTAIFETFWKEYPRRKDKGHAFREWIRQIKVTEPEVIIEGAKRYAAECRENKTEERYIKMGQGWLSGQRWLDEKSKRDESPEDRRARLLNLISKKDGEKT